MGYDRRLVGSTVLIGFLVVGLIQVAYAAPAAANEVLKWNETALKAVAADGQNPIQSTRTLAMVQGAVHDALNAINRRYAAYYFEESGDAGASPDAAVATAAHTVLVGVLPSFGTPAQKVAALAIVEDAYLASLGRVSDGSAKTKAVWRWAVRPARPCSRSARTTAPHGTRRIRRGLAPASGGRIPTPTRRTRPSRTQELARGYASSLLPGWGNVTPFTLLSAAQFWLPGPPALTSEAYARDYNEIKSLGGQVSTARTADQTEIARFWFEGPPAWNRIARTVAEARDLDAWDSARLLALMTWRWRMATSRASRSAMCTISGARSLPSARATPTATTPLPATRAGIASRTPPMSQTIPRPRAPSAGRRQRRSQASSVLTRSPSRSRVDHPSRISNARSRASHRRRGRARTPASTPASTSARRARTGSSWGARSASGRWRSTSSR